MAAKAQNRAFREQMRMQTHRRGSILGPLLMVGLGVVLLLVEVGRLSAGIVMDWYSHWWPLILVGAGVVLLLEWAIDQQRASTETVYARRGINGGIVTLLIVLAVTGATMHGSNMGFGPNFHVGPSVSSDTLEQFFGDKQESQTEQDVDFPAGARLSVVNPRGDVKVTGHSPDGKLHLTIDKSVYGWSGDESSHKAEKLTPNVSTVDGAVSIEMPSLEGGSADLTIMLPETAATLVTANHGDVNVEGMKAAVTVTALHGAVEVNDVTGTVTARTSSSGESFTAHGITGDVMLKGRAEDVNVSDVSGQVSIEGDFYGDTHFEHLGGPTTFNTSRTHFATGKVGGEVDISNGASMTADHLAGPTTLKTRSRNIDFTDMTGDISVIDSEGSVELSSVVPAGGQLGNITVENRSGAVTVNLPANPGVVLQAETKDGKIVNNLELTPVQTGRSSRLTGKLGDGKAQMDLRTTHLDIEIHAGPGSAPARDEKKGDDEK